MLDRKRIFFLLSLTFCLLILYPVAFPMAAGLVLAYLCEEPAARILNVLKIESERGRWIVAVCLVTLLQTVFIAPLLFLSWTAFQELLQFWQGMSSDGNVLATGLKALHWLDEKISPHLASLGLEFNFEQIQGKIKDALQPILQNVAVYLGSILSSTPQLIMFATVSWMSWIYFLVYGREQRAKFLPMLIPFSEERAVLSKSLGDVLKAMVLTSIVLSLVQSFLVFVSLGIVGVPKFYIWGAFSFFLSFVPVVGTAPVMLSSALYVYQQGQVFGAIFIIGMAFVIGMADNVIRPLLMKGGSDMSFFWLFLSLLGGLAMFGLPGAILGPWAFALFQETWAEMNK